MGIIAEPRQSSYDKFFAPEPVAAHIKEEAAFPIVKRPPAKSLDGSPWLQRGSRSPSVIHGENDRIWNNHSTLTDEEVALYKTPKGIVELNQEGIDLALDRRVALFFQQCILCYKMPFVFSTKGADDQIGTSPEIHLSNHGKVGKAIHKREAAHSSTIPTLLAKPKNDPEAKTFVYLKGGSNHAQHNATIGMHRDVNGADELLDGKGEEGLRAAAIKILNLVAEGLNPTKATKQFLKTFEAHAIQASEKLDSIDTRKEVLKTYAQGIRMIASQAKSDPQFFDRLIGVKIGSEEPKEKILRETIYQRRYEIIRLEETTESRLGKLIEDAKQKMGTREGSFLEFLLLKKFSETSQRKILEKLFAKTASIFEKEYQEGLSPKDQKSWKAFQTRIQNLQEKYSVLLQKLERELRKIFTHLSSSEFAYRAQVFRDLRVRIRDWTQKEFCEEYHETTGKRVSQAWVSRMEQPSRIDTKITYQTPLNQRARPVTLEDAKDCAKVFGIDVGLFLPCLVTSEY